MADTYGYGQPYPSPASPAPVPGERPKTLTYAVYGMWLGALLEIASIIVFLTMDTAEMRALMVTEMEKQPTYDPTVLDAQNLADVMIPIIQVGGVVFGLLSVGLWIWMAVMNGRGRNWARITATVFGALALLSSLSSVGNLAGNAALGGATVPTSPLGVVLAIIDPLLVIALLVLLWVRPTSTYVSAVSAARKWQQPTY